MTRDARYLDPEDDDDHGLQGILGAMEWARFLRALKAAGIDQRFSVHGFRRTFNNLLRQATTGEASVR